MTARIRKILGLVSVLLVFILPAACTTQTGETSSDTAALEGTQSAAALPTSLAGQNYRIVANPSCLIKEFASIHVDDPQGDLIAWAPEDFRLAMVRSENQKWGWFVGNLAVYDMGLERDTFITQAEAVSGDITWSPDGNSIAYIILDQAEKIYKIRVAGLNDNSMIDIFGGSEAARTDEWSSAKGITSWDSMSVMQVTSKCGPDCSRIYRFNINSLSLTQHGEGRLIDDPSLIPNTEETSPDGNWQITTDEENNVWLTSLEDGETSLLLTGTEVGEIKWSVLSRYFALRTTNQILVYEPVCTQK